VRREFAHEVSEVAVERIAPDSRHVTDDEYSG
jgi:hypothetical protein